MYRYFIFSYNYTLYIIILCTCYIIAYYYSNAILSKTFVTNITKFKNENISKNQENHLRYKLI